MSTPAENIDTSAAGAAGSVVEGLPSLSEADSWITSLHIDDPLDGSPAPLPTATATDATQGATAVAGAEKPAPLTPEAQPKVEEPKAEGEGQPPLATAKTDVATPPVEEKPVVEAKVEGAGEAKVIDPELTEAENTLVESLPEAERPAAQSRFKRSYFMDHYLNPEKPATEVVDHLAQRSPSRFAEVESTIITRSLAKPGEFAAKLFKADPKLYAETVNAIYDGDRNYATYKVTGREGLTPDDVKTALEFYDRHKDSVTDEEVAPLTLSAADEAKIAEIESYFPEEATRLRKTLEAAQRDAAENARLKTELQGKEEKPDPDKARQAELEQQQAIQKEVTDLWNMGRDTVGDYVMQKAYDPKSGVGVHVTPEERKSAPLVARLKDFKASVLFDGLAVDGKPLIEDFQKGLTEWGKGRQEFVDKLLHIDRFTQAREKDNVLDVAKSIFPHAETYYNERLKHPIFAEIDQLIELATKAGATLPKLDPQIPGQLPSQKGTQTSPEATAGGAHSDDYLIADAIARSK